MLEQATTSVGVVRLVHWRLTHEDFLQDVRVEECSVDVELIELHVTSCCNCNDGA